MHSLLDEKPVRGSPAKTQNKVHFLEDSSSSEDENGEEHKRPISKKVIILHNLSLHCKNTFVGWTKKNWLRLLILYNKLKLCYNNKS